MHDTGLHFEHEGRLRAESARRTTVSVNMLQEHAKVEDFWARRGSR